MSDDERVTTVDGLEVLMRGGTMDEARAADEAFYDREAEEEERATALAKARLERAQLNVMEQRLRVRARLQRLERQSGASGSADDSGTQGNS